MAHLMLFYELMQVKREYNAESRNQIAITHKVNNMKKQVDRTTKYYTSLFTQLENNAKSMQNQANMYFQNMTGGNSFNSWQSMCGVPQFFIDQVFGNGGTYNYSYKDGKDAKNLPLSQEQYNEMLSAYNTNSNSWYTKSEDGTTNELIEVGGTQITKEQIAAFNQVQQAASQIQNNVKMAVSQMSSMFQNNIESWLSCQKAALTAEQDAALDALNYEETMLEIDQDASKIRLEELKAEKESLQEELKERVQDDAPKFGL